MKLNITIDIPDEEIARLFGPRPASASEPQAELELLPLEVGGGYLNRAGEPVIINLHDERDNAFRGEGPYGLWYRADGTVIGFSPGNSGDLVSRIS